MAPNKDHDGRLHSPPRTVWLAIVAAALFAVVLGAGGAYIQLRSPEPPVVEATPATAESAPAAVVQAVEALPVETAELMAFDAILERLQDAVEIYRLAENPRILVIDYPTLDEQGRAMNRLAALAEKSNAPRNRLLSDSELSDFVAAHGSYVGHDYTAATIARFYTMAEAEQEPLNGDETFLRRVLLEAGVMTEAAHGYAAAEPHAAGVSVVQAAGKVDAALRDTILRHETSHGEYFTNDAYRHYCEQFWKYGMSDRERELFRKFLAASGYDAANEDLTINEMQAYLMFSPDPRTFSAEALGVGDAEIADLRHRFTAGNPPTPLLPESVAAAE